MAKNEKATVVQSATFVGNLTQDPELQFTPNGVALAKVNLAVNNQWQDRSGGMHEETLFIRGTAWREHAENISESLEKGMRVVMMGRLDEQRWEDNEGRPRTALEVNITEIGPSLRWATATVHKPERTPGTYHRDYQSEGVPPAPVEVTTELSDDQAPF